MHQRYCIIDLQFIVLCIGIYVLCIVISILVYSVVIAGILEDAEDGLMCRKMKKVYSIQ